MNKKILIPITILVLFLLGFSIAFNKHKSATISSPEANLSEENQQSVDIVEENKNEDKSSHKQNLPSNKVLTFEKSNGIIRLYDAKGILLDSLDLKMLDIGEVKELKDKKEEQEEKQSTKENFVYIKTSDGLMATKVEDGKVVLYDKEGNPIESISLNNNISETEEKIEENNSSTLNKLLEIPVKTNFTTFRTINNELVFRDNKRNALIKIEEKDGNIISELLVKNIELKNLNNVYINNNNLYLTFDKDTNIVKIPINANKKGITTKYDVKEIPDFVFVKDDCIYYSTPTKIGKYDTTVEKNNITKIDVGDKTSDVYVKDNTIYAINEFGKGKDNSVLMKINMDDLTVEGIMELKGINSKFIGINNDMIYIRQKNSIKEVDLENFKPKTARKRKEGTPVQVKDNFLYLLKDGKVEIIDLFSNENITSFNAEGFSIHIY